MTSLPEAIGRTLDDAYASSRLFPPTPTSDQLNASALLDALRGRYGVTGAARIAGIDRRTVQRAINRSTPYKAQSRTLARLREAYDQLREELERKRAEAMRNARRSVTASLTAKGGAGPRFKATICVSNDCRVRTLNMSTVFSHTTRTGIVRAYQDKDLERAGWEFDRGLNRDYLENDMDPHDRGAMYVSDVEWMTWR